MQLMGQSVKHKVFGKGVVTEQENHVVTVTFSQGEKRFLYPDAFEKFLTLSDETAAERIDTVLQKREEEQKAELQALLEEQERQQKIHNFKVSVNSQAVFALEVEGQDALQTWQVTTGTYLSGSAKGEPRIPEKMKPNSACVLTYRKDGAPEAERKIVGVFMVPEDFFGDECADGVIAAHPQYRLAIQPGQEPLFWEYFGESGSKPRWGNTDFKYCSNHTVQRLLFDLLEQRKETEDAEMMENFYSYFCSQNKLQGPPQERK